MGLFGKEPDVRQMQDSGDIDGLIKALKHHKEQVRRQAAEALGRLKGARSIDPLLEALNDRSDEVRGKCWALWAGCGTTGYANRLSSYYPIRTPYLQKKQPRYWRKRAGNLITARKCFVF